MNAIRIIALGVLLTAGGALAQAKKKTAEPAQPKTVKPVVTEADAPKSCEDQCKVMEKVLTDPCKQGAGTNKQAQQACANNSKQVVDACYGSCKEKGRIDKQYIMERIKPPAGYKAAKEKAAKEGDGDGHH